MKKIILLVAFISFGMLSAQKVAYVQENKILKTISGYETEVKEIDSLTNVYKNEISLKSKENNEKIKKTLSAYKFGEKESLESIKAKLKPADLKKLEQFQKEIEDLDKKGKEYEEKLTGMYKSKVQPKLDKVNKVLEDYSKKNKIDMIYKLENIGSALAYVNNQLDITEEIIKALK